MTLLTFNETPKHVFHYFHQFVEISAVQLSAQTFIRSAILFINTSNNAWHNQAHWLIGMPYLSTISSFVMEFSLIGSEIQRIQRIQGIW